MPEGKYRIKDGWVTEDSVVVGYSDGREMEITVRQYLDLRCEPPLEELEYRREG